jgi:hypothetical protein
MPRATGIGRLRLRLMSESDAEVTANGPLMARDARISQRGRGADDTIARLTRAFAVERVTRIELAWPAWKYSAHRGRRRAGAEELTLSDRRKPLIAATCGPTVARRASHVRFLINRFPTLQTGVHRRPPKHIRDRTQTARPALASFALSLRPSGPLICSSKLQATSVRTNGSRCAYFVRGKARDLVKCTWILGFAGGQAFAFGCSRPW